MAIILILLFFIILYKSKFIKKGINDEYISIVTTKKINGIFVLLVFLSHISQQADFNNIWIDRPFLSIISKIGQLMVTTFIFYSGYGIYESIKAKGSVYIKGIPKKRILNTLIKFDIAVIIYVIIGYIVGNQYSITTILLSLIGWSAVGNSNWYIFSIICMYIITYISFKVFKDNKKKSMMLNTILVIFFMIIISLFKECYWYNTILCYPAGMWFSRYKENIEKFLKKNKNYYITLLVTMLIFIISAFINDYIVIYSTLFVLSFIMIIILLTMKVKLNSNEKVLKFLGNNVFYIYIYQRIPMIIFKEIVIYNKSYLYFIICFISTFIITLIINWISNKIHKKKVR